MVQIWADLAPSTTRLRGVPRCEDACVPFNVEHLVDLCLAEFRRQQHGADVIGVANADAIRAMDVDVPVVLVVCLYGLGPVGEDSFEDGVFTGEAC